MQALEKKDVPFAPVNDVTEVPDDPQVRHLQSFYTLEAENGVGVRPLNCLVWFDGERVEPQEPPPVLGQHNEEILGGPYEVAANDKKGN